MLNLIINDLEFRRQYNIKLNLKDHQSEDKSIMIRIQIYILATFRHLIFIQSQVANFDVKWDQELRAKDQDLKCGTQDKYAAASSARIINGKMVRAEKYAWKAEIIHLLFYSNKTMKQASTCSGSVISQNAILTAAHCLCRMPTHVEADDDDPKQKYFIELH